MESPGTFVFSLDPELHTFGILDKEDVIRRLLEKRRCLSDGREGMLSLKGMFMRILVDHRLIKEVCRVCRLGEKLADVSS